MCGNSPKNRKNISRIIRSENSCTCAPTRLWIENEQRRETWIETVDRYVNFMKENLGDKLNVREYREIREAILKQSHAVDARDAIRGRSGKEVQHVLL